MLRNEEHVRRYHLMLTQLKAARSSSGLSQAEVALKLSKPQSFVSKCESGERRVDAVELSEFARIYDRPISYFLCQENLPSPLADAVTQALKSISKIESEEWPGTVFPDDTLVGIEKTASTLKLPLDQILATASLQLAKARLGLPERTRRSGLAFLASNRRPLDERVFVKGGGEDWALDSEVVQRAVLAANLLIEIIHDLALANHVRLFELLGLRNLSGFIGELFAGEIQALMPGHFMSNPNQDGYPDLCARTAEGQKYTCKKLTVRRPQRSFGVRFPTAASKSRAPAAKPRSPERCRNP